MMYCPPIGTIILYYGEKPWDGPTSFQEMLGDIPKELKEYVPNYKLNIVELRGDREYHFHNEEVKQLFDIARICLQGKKEELKKIEKITVSNELADMLGTILRSEYIIQKSSEQKGGIKMCTLFEEMEREAELRGIKEGEKREHEKMCTLFDEMEREAELRGKAKGIISVLKEMNQSEKEIIRQLMMQMDITENEAREQLL